MKFFQNIFLLIFITNCFSLLAQDKIRFSDGRELLCKVQGLTDTSVWINKKVKKKTKEEIVSNKNIFSIVYGDTNEVVVYKPDPSDEKAFTIIQMRSYVEGAAYARKNYHSFLPASIAFIVGAGGGYIGFWGFLPALAYDIGVSSHHPEPKSKKNENAPQEFDQFFVFGYQDMVSKKKTHNIIAGSFIGFVAGVVCNYIITKPTW